MSQGSHLYVSLFGHPTIRDATGAQIVLSMRGTALLTIVAVEPQAFTRARLAELLWPDRHVEQARASLRQCLFEMRHALARRDVEWPITADGRQIVIVPGSIDTDLAAIRIACSARDRTALAAALRAAPPSPLLDELRPSQAYVEWVNTLRGRVNAELNEALTAIFARGADAGNDDWAASAALAHARLIHVPACPLATAVLRGRPVPPEMSQRPQLQPLPLPPDAPPALYIAEPGHGAPDVALALTIREEIVSALARFREIRVVVLGGGSRPTPDTTTGYMLRVTLRVGATGTVVAARLATADGNEVLWGTRLALSGDNIDSAIEEIVERIAAAVAPTVENHLAAFAGGRPTGALYAHYLAVRARSMRPRDHAAARAAAAELETIVAEVPRFASAHLALARLYNTDFAWTEAMSSGDAERGRALTLARAAVVSDRAHSHAHTILGWCHLRQHEWGAARRCFDEAARLNPYHAERLMEIAYGLIHLGDLDGGETLLRRCLAITPVTSDGFYFDLGMLALIRGDPLLAVDQFAMIVEPDVWGAIAAALATVQAGFPRGPAAAAGRAAVLTVWPGRRMPPLASLREWVATRHPFRLSQHLDRYLSGLDSVFG